MCIRQNQNIEPTEEVLKYQKKELDKLQPIPDEIMNQYRLMPEPYDEYFTPKKKKSKKTGEIIPLLLIK